MGSSLVFLGRMWIILLDRDGDGEQRFLFLFRFHAYVAAVVEHDLPAQIHTHSYRLCGGLGGEEGVEYLVDDGLLDTDAVVVDADAQQSLFAVGFCR